MLLFDNCEPTSQGESTRVPVRVVLALQVLPDGREERVAEVGGGQRVRGGGTGRAGELLVVVLEKNQLETWLTRCIFGNGDADTRYRDLQAALDALDDMTR